MLIFCYISEIVEVVEVAEKFERTVKYEPKQFLHLLKTILQVAEQELPVIDVSDETEATDFLFKSLTLSFEDLK